MPTDRSLGKNSTNFRGLYDGYLKEFGTTYDLVKQTPVNDSMGRLMEVTENTIKIQGDLQFVTQKDLQYINAGEAIVGDGMFFTTHDVEISIKNKDYIMHRDVKWRIITSIEVEDVNGEQVYKGYLVRR